MARTFEIAPIWGLNPAMGMTKCAACGKEISDKALACPACGHPVDKPSKILSGGRFILGVLIAVVLLGGIARAVKGEREQIVEALILAFVLGCAYLATYVKRFF